MGIKGLIPLLKPIQKDIHIKEYAGQTVAVDGHCWLHRGSFGCASLLARGVPTKAYVTYFMHMVNMLLFNRVTPIIVFDGQRLPIKSVTNEARSKLRKEKRELGLSLFDKKRVGEAEKCFQQAISITPAMVANVIEELDKLNVQHIVSPYEADPQLTFLVKSGHASAVITEDSDLLAFGASRVIVKMDRFGQGTQVVHTDMFSNALCMRHFTPETFRYVCILSGCDYLSSLPGIGLKKAQDIVRRGQNTPRIFLALLRTHAMDEVEEYKEEYLKADAAFLYQFVFDPASRTYKRLNPLPKDIKVDHLVGLGESPQNRSVDILKSNGAIHLDTADYTKENDDPFEELEDSEFKELEFDEAVLKDVEGILGKVDPIVKKETKPARPTRPTDEQIAKVLLESINGDFFSTPPDEKTVATFPSTAPPPTAEKKVSSSKDSLPPAPPAKNNMIKETSPPPSVTSCFPLSRPHCPLPPPSPPRPKFPLSRPPCPIPPPSPPALRIPKPFSSPLPPQVPVSSSPTPTSTSTSSSTTTTASAPTPTTAIPPKKPNPFDKHRSKFTPYPNPPPAQKARKPLVRDAFKNGFVNPFAGIEPPVWVSNYRDPFANMPLPFGREAKRKHEDEDREKDPKSQRL